MKKFPWCLKLQFNPWEEEKCFAWQAGRTRALFLLIDVNIKNKLSHLYMYPLSCGSAHQESVMFPPSVFNHIFAF